MAIKVLYGGIFPTDISYKSGSTITAGTFGVISGDNEVNTYGSAGSEADVYFLENSSDVKNPERKIQCVTGQFILETDQFATGTGITYTAGNPVYVDPTTKKLTASAGTSNKKVGVILAVKTSTIVVLIGLPA